MVCVLPIYGIPIRRVKIRPDLSFPGVMRFTRVVFDSDAFPNRDFSFFRAKPAKKGVPHALLSTILNISGDFNKKNY